MGNTDKPRTSRLNLSPAETEKFDLLSDADVQAIQDEVKKQVLDERKKQARDELKRKLLAEERRIALPDHELMEIQMDLPGHMDKITIDMGQPPNGGVYHHGMTYKVDPNKYATLKEMQMRAWAHEEATGIPNHRTYRRPANMAIGNFVDPTLSGMREQSPISISPKDLNTPAQAIAHR